MEYNKQEAAILANKNAATLYQKQEFTSALLTLLPFADSDNFKILQTLTKTYYCLKMFKQGKAICDTVLKGIKTIESSTELSFLYLLILYECQLGIDSWKTHRDDFEKKFKVKMQWDNIRIIIPSAQQIKNKVDQLIKQQEEFKYFTQSQLPVYVIPLEWFKNLEQGKVQPVCSLDIINTNQYIDTDKANIHLNYLLKQQKMENSDYKIVGAKTWKYISSTVGGMEIKRFTINTANSVTVQAKFKSVKILCATAMKTQLITIPTSRHQSVSTLKGKIQRILIRYNLVQKQSILTFKNPKLIHIKNIHNPAILNKLILSSTGPIIDYPCIELNDISSIQEIQMLPKQFLVYQLSKSPILHCVKQQFTSSSRCVVCSAAQPTILCQCKTISYCSSKCKVANSKHHDVCKQLVKEKNQIQSLINKFKIDKNSKVPSNLKSAITGLQNMGNTCFLNAAMQCIVGIDKLSHYFLKNQHLKDINFRNPLGSQGKLACAYGQFLKQLYFTNRKAIEPRLMKRIIEFKNSTFSGYQQQDSQEFLSYFLDLIHQDLNRVKQKPHVENIQSDGRSDEIIARITLQNYYKRNKSIITDMMMGQYRSQLVCPDCGKISITFDPYMTVTLPLPNSRDRIQFEGYFIFKNGLIQKFQERLNNKSIQHTFENFKIKACHATIKQKQISNILDLDEPISTLANSRAVAFLYQIGDSQDVQFHLQIASSTTKQLISITRRLFSAPIANQKQFQTFIYQSVSDPFTKGLKIKQNQYLNYCFQNQLLDFSEVQFQGFPVSKGVHKIKVYMKPQIASKIKFNVSVGKIDLQKPTKKLTIPFLLKNFEIPQRLTEDNSWYCNVCKKHQLATKKLSLYSVPQYLILHLKRFSNKIHGRYVFNQKIDTPIDLQETQQINGRKYQLFGIVNHMGTMSGGHYTSYVKKQQWVYFDDQRCKKVELSGEYAYLLFYKAIN